MAAASFAFLVAPGAWAQEARKPNLLLVTVDTLRADRLACWGGRTGAGVRLCDLFRGGRRYAWAFSTAPSTAPSIASILTSSYPRDHGVTQHGRSRLGDALTTVAEVLARAGYATAAVLSNPVLDGSRNLGQGFAMYEDRMSRQEKNRPTLREREAAEATDIALAWARTADRPWFLWVHYQDPHGPYEPPDATPVRDAKSQTPLPVLPDQSGWRGIPRYQVLPGIRTPGAYEWRYAQEIRYLEKHLGRLVEGLDALGSPPVILLTADHGEAFGEDEFYFAHGHSVGLDQIHVPLLWRPAASPAAGAALTSLPVPVSTLDIAPTLLTAAGLDIPDGFEGRSLPRDPSAHPGDGVPRRAFFAEHRLRIALISGTTYYARDRQPLPGPVDDAISGGTLPPLPSRAAELPATGGWGAYRPVGPGAPDAQSADDLERLVRDFLAEAARERELGEELDPVSRDALRALGYLE